MAVAGFGSKLLAKAGKARPLVRKARSASTHRAQTGTRMSFREFIALVAPWFIVYKWTSIAIDRLQEVADGKLLRLLIQVPPRHGKSELMKLFAAYYLLRHQERFVGCVSYSLDNAREISEAARAYYVDAGGAFSKGRSKSVTFWKTPSAGGAWAAGANGSVTGKGAHLGIMDDPLKGREQAESQAILRQLANFYRSAFRTRINPEEGAIVICQTRWCESDGIGLALAIEEQAAEAEREGWHLVDFPALYEPWEERPHVPECVTIEEDFRKVKGQALCPERYNEVALKKLRASLGPIEFGCLFQQNPTVSDAAIFNPSWWRYRKPGTDAAGRPIPYRRRILSVDCSFTDDVGSDFVAIAALGERDDLTFDVEDILCERLDVVGTIRAIIAMNERFKPDAVLVEAAANGYAVMRLLRRRIPNLIAIKPGKGVGKAKGSKKARASAAAPLMEAGAVFLPPDAHWLPYFLNQFSRFPRAANDDVVDAVTQGLNWLQDRLPPEEIQVIWGRAVRPPELEELMARSMLTGQASMSLPA